MTAGELAVLMAAVLCSIGFAALVVVLVRVLDTLRELRREVTDLRAETRPLLHDLRITTIEARETVDEARSDLERFDRVLGSAEAIGDAVSVHVAAHRVLGTDDQVRRARQGDVEDVRPAAREHPRTERSGPRTVRRARSRSAPDEPIELEQQNQRRRRRA